MNRKCEDCGKMKCSETGLHKGDTTWICHDCVELYLDPYRTTGQHAFSIPKIPKSKTVKEVEYALPPPYGKNPAGETEADVSKEVKKALEAEGHPFRRLNSSGMPTHGRGTKPGTQNGMPDYIQFLPHGKTGHIEVKKPDGNIKQNQVDFLYSVHCLDHEVAIIASIDGAKRWANREPFTCRFNGWLPIW